MGGVRLGCITGLTSEPGLAPSWEVPRIRDVPRPHSSRPCPRLAPTPATAQAGWEGPTGHGGPTYTVPGKQSGRSLWALPPQTQQARPPIPYHTPPHTSRGPAPASHPRRACKTSWLLVSAFLTWNRRPLLAHGPRGARPLDQATELPQLSGTGDPIPAQGTITQAWSPLLEQQPGPVSASHPSPRPTARLGHRFPPAAITVGCPRGWEYFQGPPSCPARWGRTLRSPGSRSRAERLPRGAGDAGKAGPLWAGEPPPLQ